MTTTDPTEQTAKPTDKILKLLFELIPTCTESTFKAVGTTVEEMRATDADLAAQLETAARTGAHLLAIGRYLDAEHERREAFERATTKRLGDLERELGLRPG